MAALPQDLADRLELADLLARLGRAVDRADHAGILASYTEDAIDHHGGEKFTARQFADHICGGSPTSAGARFLLHALGQSLFDVDGDEATGETVYMMDLVGADGKFVHSCGRYVDRFRRVDGRWLISYRKVVSDWTGAFDVTEYPLPAGALVSTRDKADPVYEITERS